MTAKQYLRQVRYLDDLINSKQRQLDMLRKQSMSISASASNVRVQTSPSCDKIPNITAKIIDLDNEINKDINILYKTKSNINNIIKSIPLYEEQLLLNLLYIEGINYKKLPQKMCCASRTIDSMHSNALQSFDKHWNIANTEMRVIA